MRLHGPARASGTRWWWSTRSSMVGTVQMRDLQRILAPLGVARLVLVGDSLQLRSVAAGQPFRLLQRAGMATARMDDVIRQRSVDLTSTASMTFS